MFGSTTGELQKIILTKANPKFNLIGYWNGLKGAFLSILRESPTGTSKRDLCCRLRIPAPGTGLAV